MKFDKQDFWKLLKVLALLLVLYFILRFLRNFYYGNNMKEELIDERLVKDGSTPTITDGVAVVLANDLMRAMDRYGTDEDAITAVLMKIHGAADLAKIHNAFGVQPYDAVMGVKPPSWLGRYFAENLTLAEWLSEELSDKDFAPWKHLYEQLG